MPVTEKREEKVHGLTVGSQGLEGWQDTGETEGGEGRGTSSKQVWGG